MHGIGREENVANGVATSDQWLNPTIRSCLSQLKEQNTNLEYRTLPLKSGSLFIFGAAFQPSSIRKLYCYNMIPETRVQA